MPVKNAARYLFYVAVLSAAAIFVWFKVQQVASGIPA